MCDVKFSCPHCQAKLEGSSAKSGLAATCPACGELVIIPEAPPQSPDQAAVDLIADTVCGTAKLGYKAVKIATPIVAKAGVQIATRTAKAAIPAVQSASRAIDNYLYDGQPKPKPTAWQNAYSAFRLVYIVTRNLLGM